MEKTEEKELEWFEQPDPLPEEPRTEYDLMKQIETMRLAQKGIPKALILKQLAALVFIVINGGLLYSAIGKPLSEWVYLYTCLLYTSPSPRDRTRSRMPSSA